VARTGTRQSAIMMVLMNVITKVLASLDKWCVVLASFRRWRKLATFQPNSVAQPVREKQTGRRRGVSGRAGVGEGEMR